MWCAADNHNYVCHICAKGILDLIFHEAVIDKISNFHEIAPNFKYSQNHIFLRSIIRTFLTNCFPINFMPDTCKGYTFTSLPVVCH